MIKFYQNNDKTTDIWLTPPSLIEKLGEFDLDPCCPNNLTWKTAKKYYSLENGQNGLELPWNGRVFLNPPYSNWVDFLKKLSEYNNGIALIFARVETRGFFDYIWNKANSLLFLKGRVKFLRSDGSKAQSSTQPSVLIAYGEENSKILENCGIEGKFIFLR